MSDLVGKSILHYRILEHVGQGGMGVVYKAEDTELDREVAIKFLPRHIAASSEERERFKVEAKAAAALNHANIATIHAIEKTDDETFIVMEYIKGRELKDRIDEGPLPIDDTLKIGTRIAEGLQIAHEAGVVHRDIKSSNIMLTDRGEVKIMDFGLAKRGGQTKLTKEGTTLGTIAYMSPEHTRGEDVDQRSDIFSLGVLLYEMLTGQLPFKGDYDQAVAYSILNEEPAAITGLRTGVPLELERIINKCLKKDPSERYQRAEGLIVDLRGLQKETETKAILTEKGLSRIPADRKKPAYLAPVIIGIVMLVAIAGYWLLTSEPVLKERVPVAVVDFINETGEPELNGLSGLLITALEQSRYLDVMSRARMFDELKKIGRQDITFVDEETGREIARQANISALAVATIRKLGQTYGIDFKIIDPESGDHLFTASEEGKGQDSIFGMIDRLAEKTRIDLKEESEAIQMASKGIADVTTTNLEAYHHYFLGEELMNSLDIHDAREEYQKAIALDSTFGLAYYRLAYTYSWNFADEKAKKPLAKAFALIDRIPEKERFLLRATAAEIEKGYAAAIPVAKEMEHYYPDDKEMLYLIGDWSYHSRQYPQAVAYFEKVLSTDPTHEPALYHLAIAYARTNQADKYQSAIERLMAVDPAAAFEHTGIYHADRGEFEAAIANMNRVLDSDSTRWNAYQLRAFFYGSMGRFDKALESARDYLKRNPVPLAYWRVTETYILMGDLAKAREIVESAIRHLPNSVVLVGRGIISAYQEDLDLAEKQFMDTIAEDQPHAVRRLGYVSLAGFYMRKGQFTKMNEMFEGRINLALSDNDNDTAAEMLARRAYWNFKAWHDKGRVRHDLQRAAGLANVTNEDYFAFLAKSYALMGENEKANLALAHVINKSVELEVESHELMQKREWDRAITVNKSIIKGWARQHTSRGYDNAVCYYEKGEYDRAIAAARAAAGFYGNDHEYVRPQSFRLFGKCYEKKGDIKLAVENYKKFLEMWRDADRDLPDLIDVKARLAKLNDGD